MSISTSAQDARETFRGPDGKFGHQPHHEGEVILDPMSPSLMGRRGLEIARLADQGYAPAIVHTTGRDARRGDDGDSWWTDHFVSGEHATSDHGQTAKMPDGYTPSEAPGKSLTGTRRTHRMAYTGGGVSVRMPSATSIRRYASDDDQGHGGTFDIPVEVTATGSGNTHSGWVRVTHRDGRYHVTAPSFPHNSRVHTAEAVNAVLEARRPRTALSRIESLPAAAATRRVSAGMATREVGSSWIAGVGHDGGDTMVVDMGARAYGYRATRDDAEEMARSGSPGRAYNRVIKGRKQQVEVSRCAGCGRFSSADRTHACPIEHATAVAGVVHESNQVVRAAAHAVTVPVARAITDRAGRTHAESPPPVTSQDADGVTQAPPGLEVTGLPTDSTGQRSDLDPDWTLPVSPLPDVPHLAGGSIRPMDPATPAGRRMRAMLAATVDGSRPPRRDGDNGRGPAGFTMGVADQIGGLAGDNEEAGGIIRLSGRSAGHTDELLARLHERALDDRQGDGPTLRTVLSAARDHDDVGFGGYAVVPGRSDERVTMDEITVNLDRPVPIAYDTYDDDEGWLYERASEAYGLDATAPPDELDVEYLARDKVRVRMRWD